MLGNFCTAKFLRFVFSYVRLFDNKFAGNMPIPQKMNVILSWTNFDKLNSSCRIGWPQWFIIIKSKITTKTKQKLWRQLECCTSKHTNKNEHDWILYPEDHSSKSLNWRTFNPIPVWGENHTVGPFRIKIEPWYF